MDAELIRQYTLIVDFLGHVLGPDYEIALHELEDDSNRIIAIANGELTGRHIGSPLSNKMLEFVAGNLYETQNYVLNFESVSATGKTMCSNSMFIKGRHGELSGLLCINFDASRYDELSRQGVSGQNITGTMEKVEGMMATIVLAFEKQLNSLFGDQAMDISTDITVLDNMMAREGLTGGDAVHQAAQENPVADPQPELDIRNAGDAQTQPPQAEDSVDAGNGITLEL